MSSFLPTAWEASALWINAETLHTIAPSSLSSDPTLSPSAMFVPPATRRPLRAPPTRTRGRVLQRSWSFPVCQRCFIWKKHRQALEDCRGTAQRPLSPSWHALLAAFLIKPFLVDLSGCGWSVLLTSVPGLLLWQGITNNSCSLSTCWVYFIPRDLSVWPWSESCSWRGEELDESSCVYLLQKSKWMEGFQSYVNPWHWIEYYWSLSNRLKCQLHAIKSAWSSEVPFLWWWVPTVTLDGWILSLQEREVSRVNAIAAFQNDVVHFHAFYSRKILLFWIF